MKSTEQVWADYGRIVIKDKQLDNSRVIFHIPAIICIYLAFFPILLLDISMIIFQNVYFRTYGIPFIKRSEYVRIDRNRLSKLNGLQKFNCMYCGYANGVMAWVKDLVIQTETYSCAIKHDPIPKGQEHQSNFHGREHFS